MTKKIILLLSLMGLTICFAQKGQKDTSKAKSPSTLQVKKLVKTDTTTEQLKDTFILSGSNSQVRVLIVKDEDDWFVKYIFPLITLVLGIAIPLILESIFTQKKLRVVPKTMFTE